MLYNGVTKGVPLKLYWKEKCTRIRKVSFKSKSMVEAKSMSANKDKQLLSVAPMMDWTDVYYRNLARMLTKHTWLYTEMIVDKTLIHKEAFGVDRYLKFPELQHPVVLQLGGNNPKELGKAVRIASSYGYDEINLNCGCPSPRVSGKGCFGAALMKEPTTVKDILSAMEDVSSVPVTVKCRLGVDDNDTYPELKQFIQQTSENLNLNQYIIHARKAFLEGLSPAQNRNIPPLRHAWVYQLAQDFPHLKFFLNGGVQSCYEAQSLLNSKDEDAQLEGIMIGRAAYKTPWHCLADADRVVFGASGNPCSSRRQLLREYGEYCDRTWEIDVAVTKSAKKHVLRKMMKPLLGIFHAEPGTNKWRRTIDQLLLRDSCSVSEMIIKAMADIPGEILDASPESLSTLGSPVAHGRIITVDRSKEVVN